MSAKNDQIYYSRFKKHQQKKPGEIRSANKVFLDKFYGALNKDPQYKAFLEEAEPLQARLKTLLPAYQRSPKEYEADFRRNRSQWDNLNKKYRTTFASALNAAGGEIVIDKNLANFVLQLGFTGDDLVSHRSTSGWCLGRRSLRG